MKNTHLDSGGTGVSIFDDPEVKEALHRSATPLKQKIPPRFQRKKAIIISGPTAVGKTSVSLTVARELGGEIISADSMQVYRGMDIGTAKVSQQERAEIPHHLIDTHNITERYSVAQFYQNAQAAIKDILAREKVPIIIGGTGFYINSLLYGPPLGPPSDPELRAELEEELMERGNEAMYAELMRLDPKYAVTITHNDRHKIIRGLEIVKLTEMGVSEFGNEIQDRYNFRCWFLYKDRRVLYPEIEKRCDKMLADGFLEEVRRVDEECLRDNLTASHAIGYRQALEYLDSAKTPEDLHHFITTFKRASRRYAKRQFTWFRREPAFRWYDVEDLSVGQAAETIIQDYEISF